MLVAGERAPDRLHLAPRHRALVVRRHAPAVGADVLLVIDELLAIAGRPVEGPGEGVEIVGLVGVRRSDTGRAPADGDAVEAAVSGLTYAEFGSTEVTLPIKPSTVITARFFRTP